MTKRVCDKCGADADGPRFRLIALTPNGNPLEQIFALTFGRGEFDLCVPCLEALEAVLPITVNAAQTEEAR